MKWNHIFQRLISHSEIGRHRTFKKYLVDGACDYLLKTCHFQLKAYRCREIDCFNPQDTMRTFANRNWGLVAPQECSDQVSFMGPSCGGKS